MAGAKNTLIMGTYNTFINIKENSEGWQNA